MQAAKTFDRNGIRYRPGDALPPDLDAPTLAHYRRYGMVREASTPAPVVKKPVARKQTIARPAENKTAANSEVVTDQNQTNFESDIDQVQQQQTQTATDFALLPAAEEATEEAAAYAPA